ncbi:MAG: DNA-binding protein [Trichodesmium sp.]
MSLIKFGITKGLIGAIAIGMGIIAIATPSLAQTPIGELQRRDRNLTISGQVIGVSDNEFMLDDGTGQILVDVYPNQSVNLSVGEQVTVVGEYDDDDFDAFSITRQDGSVIDIRSVSYGDDDWDDD